ncbi:MAG: hypothetical protein IJO22_05570 [Oscillospiraceae bacterium]|nr:hypothetical protein [Oscillospiraceae bacterium]
MNEIITVAGIGIISTGLIIILKQYRPEFAFGTLLASGIIILLYIVSCLDRTVDYIVDIISVSGIDHKKFMILFQSIGIIILSEISAEICSDCGQGSVSSKIILAGKAIVLMNAMPLYSEIIDIIKNLLNV